MGKKSKKGVTRAGTKKHPGAGKGRAKSDASSRASRDNISVDGNPDLARLASESKAPTGPPPKDVVAVVNNLVAAQQLNGEVPAAAEMAKVVAFGLSSGAANKENKMAEPEEKIANIEEVDNSPSYVGDVNVTNSEDKEAEQPSVVEEPVNVEVNEVIAPVVEPPTPEIPVVEPPTLDVASPSKVAEPSKQAVLEPESREEPAAAPEAEKVEEPAELAVETPKVEKVADVEPQKEKVEVPESIVKEVPVPPASVATAKDVVEEPTAPIAEKVTVAEPEKPKVDEVPESNGSIPPAAEATMKEAAPDVWSQKLRDVVANEPTKPVLDVTPPPTKSASRSAAPLDLPSASEVEVQQTDCGCLIL